MLDDELKDAIQKSYRLTRQLFYFFTDQLKYSAVKRFVADVLHEQVT